MKRTLVYMLALVLSFSMCACGKSQKSSTVAGEDQTEVLESLSFEGGGLGEMQKLEDASLYSDEEYAKVNKAMRAYTKPTDSNLMVNNAKSFYYYSQISSDLKQIYDALLLVAEDPESTDNIVSFYTTEDPRLSTFTAKLSSAYFALLFDHPELFWLYKGNNSSIQYGARENGSGYDVYVRLSRPYANYRSEMAEFNDAVEKFLAGINTNAKDNEIAREIHDKLDDLVTYDYPVAENNDSNNYAHSAFGALVRNSSGQANTAVCDGYSLAYEYLLQQCGIEATVMLGKAGNNTESAGGHAWNLVKLNGSWYEVDSTWDDLGSIKHSIDVAKIDDTSKSYYYEALEDATYSTSIGHYLYNVTTSDITNYNPGDRYYYYSKDGKYRYSLLSSSVHIRASEISEMGIYGTFVSLAPTATGTEYANQ